jgi:uncharacterized repeat protein (TIGR03847 family)
MSDAVYDFDAPDRFVAGTVGRPGEREFYLQVREGRRLISVALEKQQVQLLAERLDAMLDELLRDGRESVIPAAAPVALEDTDPLETPVDPEFRAVALAIGWDDDDLHVVVEARSTPDDDDADDILPSIDEPAEPTRLLRVRLHPGHARAFAQRALTLVSAGRPTCPFCTLPLDPDGHVCPRANGYRR